MKDPHCHPKNKWLLLAVGGSNPIRTALFCLLIFSSLFQFHHGFFYTHGGYLLDSSWTTSLYYQNGLLPVWPPAVKIAQLGHLAYSDFYFQYHPSPLFSLYSLISYLSPLDRLNWFSLCQSLLFTLAAYSCFSLADLFGAESGKKTGLIAGGLLGLAYFFNAFVINTLNYPHPEASFVAFGLCFIVSLLRSRYVLACTCFILACCSREDSGFHLTALTFMLWIASHIEPHLEPFKKRFLFYAGLGFSISLVLISLQHLFFPLPEGVPSPFRYAFMGEKGFFLNLPILAERFALLFEKSLFLILPVLTTLLTALLLRKWTLVLGWLAYVPWFLVNFLSNMPARQVFETYHGYPFIFAIVWPLLVLRPPSDAGLSRRLPFFVSVFTLGLSSIIGLHLSSPDLFQTFGKDLSRFHYQTEKPFEALEASLRDQPEIFGRIGMDDAVGCLYLEQLEYRHVDYAQEHYDTLLFFKKSMFTKGMMRLAQRERLFHCHELAGTNLLIVSNREIRLFPNGEARLNPGSPSLWLWVASFQESSAERLPDGSISQTRNKPGILAYGPYLPLAPGRYEVRFHLDYSTGETKSPKPVATLDVCHDTGNVIRASKEVSGCDLPSVVVLPFEVRDADASLEFEFRVTSLTRKKIKLTGLDLKRISEK